MPHENNMDSANCDSSDDEVLLNLLANHVDEDVTKDIQSEASDSRVSEKKLISKQLQDIDFNEWINNEEKNECNTNNQPHDTKIELRTNNYSSDEDEDNKYFEQQKYSDYGKKIKNLLKQNDSDKDNSRILKDDKPFVYSPKINLSNLSQNKNVDLANGNDSKSISFTFQNDEIKKEEKKNDNLRNTPKDVYSDPFFGLRIVRPIVSTAELTEKMQGRKAVPIGKLKIYLRNLQLENLSEDWVTAGVVIDKSLTKTSQKGHQYAIWKISDLSSEMKTFGLFLFGNAYKTLWKTPTCTVLGILNSSVLENKNEKDEATLSVDNAQKVMILGISKELGKCRSIKKNGEPCSMPINTRFGDHCVYHVKQEYGKFSRRSDLQIKGLNTNFGPPIKKKENLYSRQQPEYNFVGIPAKKNHKQIQKDNERLALLRGEKIIDTEKCSSLNKTEGSSPQVSIRPMYTNMSSSQKLSNLDLNNKFPKNLPISKTQSKFELNFSPKLGSGSIGGSIDLSENISKEQKSKAKLSALAWVKKHGEIKKQNPNSIRSEKTVMVEKGLKRKREEDKQESSNGEESKQKLFKSKFAELLEAKSAHQDLIEKREDEETEKYFNKLEMKEKMEEKMLSTFKVDCKAVRCSICKYIAFSSSDLCKTLQHPIKIIDAVKRFFKCGDCGNRTISLDRIPSTSCSRCSSSKWIRAPMMDERRLEISGPKLCIRGEEEKYVGTVTEKSLNLLVPDT